MHRLRHAAGDLFSATARAGQRPGDAKDQPADAQPAQRDQPRQKIIRRVVERLPAAEMNRPRPLGHGERHHLAMGAAQGRLGGVKHSILIVEQVPMRRRGPVEDFKVNIIEGTVDHAIHKVRDDEGGKHPALQAALPLMLSRHRLAVAVDGVEQDDGRLAGGILYQLNLRRERGSSGGGGEVAGPRTVRVAGHVKAQCHPVAVQVQRLDESYHVMIRDRRLGPDIKFRTVLRAGRP